MMSGHVLHAGEGYAYLLSTVATADEPTSVKTGLFDYYESLDRLTDNTGTKKLNTRYKEFMRVASQWRHLKALKRAGRGHDPAGVAGTKHGELAVLCPACPRPHVNLPDNWATVSDDLKYVLFPSATRAYI